MWPNLSPLREDELMPDRQERYLAFVDYLGTRALYGDATANADRIEEQRSELEHGVQIRLQQCLADKKIEIGVFSDTIIVAGIEPADVFGCAASLLDFVLRKSLIRGDAERLRLLRGGVSRGVALRSSYLRTGGQVHAIPFFDGSLAYAYELEGVRRGSRLFVSAEAAPQTDPELAPHLFRWRNMTGFGRPTGEIWEFLWPGYVCRHDPPALANILRQAFSLWRGSVERRQSPPDTYRETLYHLDETVKCIARSYLAFKHRPELKAILPDLVSLLPAAADPQDGCPIRYAWGIWFQVLFTICQMGRAEHYPSEVRFTLETVKRRGYLDKWIAETDLDDYAAMRGLIGCL